MTYSVEAEKQPPVISADVSSASADAGVSIEFETNRMVLVAQAAQREIEPFSDDDLDEIVVDIANTVKKRIPEFAEKTVAETGIGNALHKQHKIGLVCNQVAENLLGVKTFGKVSGDWEQDDVIEYANPLGVILAVIPMTNPVPCSLFKMLHAIKTRNAIVLSYPSKAKGVGLELVCIVKEILEDAGISRELIQVVTNPFSREKVQALMAHPGIDRILATGGSGLVKQAHSSGNPALGVGPGNVPVFVTACADLDRAAECIVSSKHYDNGIICGSENNIIAEASIAKEFLQVLENHGAVVLNGEEKLKAIAHWFDPEGNLNREILGKSADFLAQYADIKRNFPIKVFVLKATDEELNILGKEKLAPILSFITVKQEMGLSLMKQFLKRDGAGHTAVIHTKDADMIERFGCDIPAGRLLINTPATFGMMGVSTDLPLSFMLGSGSWGKNLTTNAVTWKDFVNIKRLAVHTVDVVI